MPEAVPSPLPIHSARLRDQRFMASIHGPRDERGAYPFIAEGRFATFDDAKMWADRVHPEAALARIDHLAAATGWRRDSVAARRGGVWEMTRR